MLKLATFAAATVASLPALAWQNPGPPATIRRQVNDTRDAALSPLDDDLEESFLPSSGSESRSEAGSKVLVPGNLYLVHEVTVTAQSAGVVRQIAPPGQRMNKGEVAVSLEDALLRAEASAARRELEVAKVEAENDVDARFAEVSAKVNKQVLERSLSANKKFSRAVSQTEIERLRLEFQRSQLSAEQADRQAEILALTLNLKEDQVAVAELRLDQQTLRSPIDGVVVRVDANVGEWISPGQTLVKIVDDRTLRFRGLVDSYEILPDQINESATLQVINERDERNATPIATVDVKITFVSPVIDPGSGLYEIHAELDNADQKLFAGMKARLVLRRK